MSRTVLVTGGTRGIGEAICILFKQKGYKVAANYAHRDDVAAEFNKNTNIPVYKWDVSNLNECAEGVKKVEKDLGSPVEVLVNNAGITKDSFMHKMEEEAWNSVIHTNLSSCFNMSKAVINSMREKSFGRIINISSINAQEGQMGQTNYSAAKAGVFGFTKALARENAVKGITVNAVAPGYIDTDMVRGVKPEIVAEIIKKIPIGRLGKAEEVANCVLFLASEHSSFITGETISVNGGHHME